MEAGRQLGSLMELYSKLEVGGEASEASNESSDQV